MEVISITPHGYCLGVTRAINIAKKARLDYPDRKVYLLGNLVHNEIATASLASLGLLTLDEKEAPLLTQLKKLKPGDVVVFSAHGHPLQWEIEAKKRGLILIDATCQYVNENLQSGLAAKEPLFYLGASKHLEAESFRENCPKCHFLDAKNPIVDCQGESCSLVAQTTLSDEELDIALSKLRSNFPTVNVLRSRCDATRLRQMAIRALPSDIDVLIVLGSSTSNNSKKLAEIGASLGIETHLVLDVNDLKKLDLSKKKKAALSSGASTPKEVYDEAKAYLASI